MPQQNARLKITRAKGKLLKLSLKFIQNELGRKSNLYYMALKKLAKVNV